MEDARNTYEEALKLDEIKSNRQVWLMLCRFRSKLRSIHKSKNDSLKGQSQNVK
jgi:hypothetical protein